MLHIDEKFKDSTPEATVENIKKCLASVGINVQEKWTETGVDNCFTLRVDVEGGFPGQNGKGVTKELARASAYGELIECLQTGLLFFKYQGLEKADDMTLYAFCPDAKYMTKDELVENGEWMDYLIDSYGSGLTRESLAEQCLMYAGSEKALTVPYYSIFEDKYVYLPDAFVKSIYGTNGCCAGNTREEAWIHAMSEMLERIGCIRMIESGKAVPAIPDEILQKYEKVYATISQLRSVGFDVQVFDISGDINFPIVATRIINKKTGGYLVDCGADPIFEIAVKRTFTEVFQNKSIESFMHWETLNILNDVNDISRKNNVLNQLETATGQFTVDFFSEEVSCDRKSKVFSDNTQKNNRELANDMLEMYKSFGKPMYIRNCSFLGFHSYFFIVPGLSEARAVKITEPLQEQYFADNAAHTLRYIEKASIDALDELLLTERMFAGIRSRDRSYRMKSGIPLCGYLDNAYLLYIHLAYAAYKCGKDTELYAYLKKAARAAKTIDDSQKCDYANLLARYFKMKSEKVDDARIAVILKHFHTEESYAKFENALKDEKFFDGMLIRCEMGKCEGCPHLQNCHFPKAQAMMRMVGPELAKFTDGQNRDNFKILQS